MSRKKKRKQRRDNIEAKSYYDPFPKSGLVKQYEPFIRKHVGEFCKYHPGLDRNGVLFEAVQIAIQAEKRFKPELGYDFSTFLRNYLKGLGRYTEKEASFNYVPWSPEERRSNELFDEAEKREAAPIPAPDFLSSFNGARVFFDHQWIDKDGKRHRVGAGFQLIGADPAHSRGVTERASPDLKTLLGIEPQLSSTLIGRMRAVIDHNERRLREADQEAENCQNGDYGPVFFDAADQKADVKFYKGRRPPQFRQERKLMARLDDAYSHDDGWVSKLSDTVASGGSISEVKNQQPPDEHMIVEAATAERPFLSKHEMAMLDWLLGLLYGADRRSLVQFAADQDVSRGYAPELKERVIKKIEKRSKK